MPSKLPEKKYNCIACQDTKKNSQRGDCFACSINRRIARPDTRPTQTHEPTIRNIKGKPKLIPRPGPPPKRSKKNYEKDE